GDGLVFVNAKKMRISADETLIEDPTRKLIEMLPFERFQVPAGDLGGLRNFIQGDASHLPFAPKPITKSTHSSPIAFCW
ncbi:MAG TPA: hypothetical protein VN872_01105, partial [Candidatus Acidoferrum sp.]|nr:hypothetical protein [Candidatus Acidoferrum sp.]